MLPLYLSFFAVNCKLRRCKLETCSQPVKINESPYLQLERNCSKMRSKEGMFFLSMFLNPLWSRLYWTLPWHSFYTVKRWSHTYRVTSQQANPMGIDVPGNPFLIILHTFWPERSFGLLPIQKSFGPILL